MEEEEEDEENYIEMSNNRNINHMPPKFISNTIRIIYNIENQSDIRLFGNNFVENNKNNCYIKIEGKQIELCNIISLTEKQKESSILEIKLI